MGFRAVLFDIGDTLWHSGDAPPAAEFRRIASERAREFFAKSALPPGSASEAARVAWDAVEMAMKRARDTDRIEPDYAAAARTALAERGVNVSGREAASLLETIYVSGVDGGKAAYPDARPTLDALRERGFKLGIVSNRAFGGRRFRDDLSAAGLDIPWDTIVVSVEVGFLKPHPEVFRRALEGLKTQAAETLMVGNSLAEDIAGAQSLGMRAAWKRSAPDAEGVEPDFTFDQVGELLAWPPLARAVR
ncbi:MAG: HAD family hydrolase [Dehalococcoidia bacterium]